MKKIFLLLAIMLPMMFVSCSDDDKDEPKFEYGLEFSLYHGTTKQLESDANVTWHSENEFVAKVDGNGLVEGNHVGETYIVATNGYGNSTKCHVTVLPKYNTYTEPVLDFGASSDIIKSKERRTLLLENKDVLLFNGGNDSEVFVRYPMENGAMAAAAISIKYNYMKEAVDFIFERYQIIGEQDNVYFFINDNIDSFNMAVGVGIANQSLMIAYMPYTPTKSITDATNTDLIEKFEQVFEKYRLKSLPTEISQQENGNINNP